MAGTRAGALKAWITRRKRGQYFLVDPKNKLLGGSARSSGEARAQKRSAKARAMALAEWRGRRAGTWITRRKIVIHAKGTSAKGYHVGRGGVRIAAFTPAPKQMPINWTNRSSVPKIRRIR